MPKSIVVCTDVICHLAKHILIKNRKDPANTINNGSFDNSVQQVTASLSPRRKLGKEIRKSLKLYQGRQQNNIIPEEYEPHATHSRSGFKKFT